jgi:hypothetical protein
MCTDEVARIIAAPPPKKRGENKKAELKANLTVRLRQKCMQNFSLSRKSHDTFVVMGSGHTQIMVPIGTREASSRSMLTDNTLVQYGFRKEKVLLMHNCVHFESYGNITTKFTLWPLTSLLVVSASASCDLVDDDNVTAIVRLDPANQ